MVGNLIAHQQVLTFANGVWWQWGVGVGPKPSLLSVKQHLYMARPLLVLHCAHRECVGEWRAF